MEPLNVSIRRLDGFHSSSFLWIEGIVEIYMYWLLFMDMNLDKYFSDFFGFFYSCVFLKVHDYSNLLHKPNNPRRKTDKESNHNPNSHKNDNDSDNDDDDEEEDTILSSTNAHSKNCRSVLFSSTDPNIVYSCGNDSALSAMYIDRAMKQHTNDSKGDIAWRISNAHPNQNGSHR